MAANSSKLAAGKKNVGLPAIIVCVIALVVLLVWMGKRAFAPDSYPETAAAKEKSVWWDKVAKESGGDISKLSPEDIGTLQKATYGHGEVALKAYAQQHGYAK